MGIEQGIVTKMGAHGPTTAWVKTVQSSACKSCSSRHSCNASSGGKEREVEAINSAGAKVGDRIQLAIKTSSLLKATFLLYVFPILCMLIGGFVGNAAAPQLNMDASLLSATAALACLVMALLIVRIKGRRLASKAAYRPKIIRVIGHEPLHSEETGSADSVTLQDAKST